MNQPKRWQCDNPLCHTKNKPEWDKCITCGKPRPVTVIIDDQRVSSLGEFIRGKKSGRGTP